MLDVVGRTGGHNEKGQSQAKCTRSLVNPKHKRRLGRNLTVLSGRGIEPEEMNGPGWRTGGNEGRSVGPAVSDGNLEPVVFTPGPQRFPGREGDRLPLVRRHGLSHDGASHYGASLGPLVGVNIRREIKRQASLLVGDEIEPQIGKRDDDVRSPFWGFIQHIEAPFTRLSVFHDAHEHVLGLRGQGGQNRKAAFVSGSICICGEHGRTWFAAPSEGSERNNRFFGRLLEKLLDERIDALAGGRGGLLLQPVKEAPKKLGVSTGSRICLDETLHVLSPLRGQLLWIADEPLNMSLVAWIHGFWKPCCRLRNATGSSA